MDKYSQAEKEEAIKALRSSIGKCEKTLSKLKDGSWQKRWTGRQLETYYLSVGLLEPAPVQYSGDQLTAAAQTLNELMEKCKGLPEKFIEGSAQNTLARRRLKAFSIALTLINEQTDKQKESL